MATLSRRTEPGAFGTRNVGILTHTFSTVWVHGDALPQPNHASQQLKSVLGVEKSSERRIPNPLI
jgi:hypothetical protein